MFALGYSYPNWHLQKTIPLIWILCIYNQYNSPGFWYDTIKYRAKIAPNVTKAVHQLITNINTTHNIEPPKLSHMLYNWNENRIVLIYLIIKIQYLKPSQIWIFLFTLNVGRHPIGLTRDAWNVLKFISA